MRTAPVSLVSANAGDDSAQGLEVEDLFVEFRGRKRVTRAVNGVSLVARPGRTLAILGESGSGKSVSAQAIMGLLHGPHVHVSARSILVNGTELRQLQPGERRKVLGEELSMVYQSASLNPSFTVGWQIAEMFRVHRSASKRDAREQAIDLLERVGIPSPRQRASEYPHQFSGGMRQRVAIAMAIALSPKVLIADEPTTALDVTVQAQILDLLKQLQDEFAMALVLITHDLGVVRQVADDIAVMYAGSVVESGPAGPVLSTPAHPYTVGLIESIPRATGGARLKAIPGSPPDLSALPTGCPFQARCRTAQDICVSIPPLRRELEPQRTVACHFAEEVRRGQ